MTAPPHEGPAYEMTGLHASEIAFAAGQHRDLFADATWSAAAVKRLLEMPGCFALGARAAGEIVGLILARAVAEECEILWLFVVPARRRRSVGRCLLQAALERAAAVGARSALLEVAEANQAAVALYLAMGFQPCGRRKAYYETDRTGRRHDALILRKALGSGEHQPQLPDGLGNNDEAQIS